MHNNNTIVPYISLCSGYEGIGLGLHRCIPNLRCIAYCEREAFAIANLVAKMEKGLLDEAPVFTDVTTFPWEQFAPYMAGGILSFGWPCQPVSMAGKRKATEDERWLFDIIADGISIMRPGMLFAENVEGLLSAKMPDGSSVFGHCIERLEWLHYKVEAGIFSAAEVGAPHQRKRVFILAYDQSQRIQRCWADWLQEPRPHAGQGLPLRCGDAGCGELADALCNGGREGGPIRQGADGSELVGHGQSWGVIELADAGRIEPQGWGSASQGQQSGAGRIPRGEPAPCNDQVWPSRPGQPQHGWEPPRVVASERKLGDSESVGDSKSRENNGRESRDMDEASSQWGCCDNATNGASEDASMGDSESGRAGECGNKDGQREGLRFTWASPIGDMGNTEQLLFPATGEHGAMDEESGIPTDGEGSEPAQADSEPSATREREVSGGDASECSEIEFSLGRDAYEPSVGVDFSELSGLSHSELAEIREWMVKTDNRTDELRLLGNGVVKATATRAFLTLLEKLK